ncbi:hypothetical protein CFP56_006886 [Quercus suber]|uniref:Uncharacterized protein n=1 Tax=Quercus suber TaxID=58331 RepID=A0AAW0M788_QUESU
MPVKTLIRAFLSLFDSTITEPKFIATHLNQAISLSNNNNITHNGYLLYPPHLSSPDIEEELHTVVYNTDHTPTEVHAVVYNTDHSLTEVSSFEIPYVLGGTNIQTSHSGVHIISFDSESLNEENLGIPQTRDVIYTADFGESLVLLNGADIKNQ